MTAQTDGVVEHMPAREAQNFDDIYRRLRELYATENAEAHALEEARRILFLYPQPERATAQVLDEAIRSMSDVLVLHSRVARIQTLIYRRHAEFSPVNALASIDALLGISGSPIQGAETPGMDVRVNAIEAEHE